MNQNIKLIQSHNSQEEYAILIDKQVGKGSFGTVYKAFNVKDQREQLAVKVLPVKGNMTTNYIERELDVIRELPIHRNLIRIKPIKYFSENNHYLFMDYCKSTLHEQISQAQGRRFKEAGVIQLFYQLLSGYQVLYDRKILHQDIKPQNILVKDGVYKLADFGLSVFYENHKFGKERVGALGYIAPEKLFKQHYQGNPKSDVYSLGIVLFEAIVGRHPYIFNERCKSGNSISTILEELKEAKIKVPQSVIGQFSLEFNQLFDKVIQMISKNQLKRISFPHLIDFINKSPLFAQIRNSPETTERFHDPKHIQNKNGWVVKEVSQVLTVPFDASDQEQEKIVKQHKESKSLKLKSNNQENVERMASFLLERRIMVYFLDRIARRLAVRKLKNVSLPIEDKTILHLILYSKSLVSEVMSEIQAPKMFTYLDWKIFSNTEHKKLIDLVLNDNRYLEDTIFQTFSSNKSLSKAQYKNFSLIYRSSPRDKRLQCLNQALVDNVKQMSLMVASGDSSTMTTLSMLLKAIQLIQKSQLSSQEVEELQAHDRHVDEHSPAELMQRLVDRCTQKNIIINFDFSDQITQLTIDQN